MTRSQIFFSHFQESKETYPIQTVICKIDCTWSRICNTASLFLNFCKTPKIVSVTNLSWTRSAFTAYRMMILYCTLIWVITENDGTGWLTYRECFILFRGSYTNSWKARLHAGQFRVNCSWILPTGVNKVPYARAKDIDFLSAKKIWSKKSLTRELRIYNSRKPRAIQQLLVLGLHRPTH